MLFAVPAFSLVTYPAETADFCFRFFRSVDCALDGLLAVIAAPAAPLKMNVSGFGAFLLPNKWNTVRATSYRKNKHAHSFGAPGP